MRDTTKAISYFQKALAHLHKDYASYPLAKAELKWLQTTKPVNTR